MRITDISVFEDAENYEKARIPGIICTSSGCLIAYCELRRSDSDWAVIDVGMKKSYDGGKTWSDRKILVSGGKANTVNNPVMIADGKTVHFLYCINYHYVFYMKSDDEGESWSAPKEITDDIRNDAGDFFFSCIALGPTHGIKLSSGELTVPLWLAYNKEDNKSHHPSVIGLLYSVNNGETWRLGEICGYLNDASEFCIAETADGKIIANIRHENKERFRAKALINEKFSITDIHYDKNLPDPICCGGMCAYKNEIFFSNCANKETRTDLTLRKMNADGEVIESIYLVKEAGYSDVAVSPAGESIYVLYENGKSIKLISVNNSKKNYLQKKI